MRISPKSATYYFFSFSALVALAYLTISFLSYFIWEELMHAAGKLLPFIGFVTLGLVLLITCIYLFRKGQQDGKAKEHIRFL